MNMYSKDIEPDKLDSKDIEQLLTEADELLDQINSDVIGEMEEEQRIQIEIQARNLEKLKLEVRDKAEKEKMSETGSGAEGMHEAILDIVKAGRDLTKFLS
ncbi:MAG: hypothetical protein K9J83_07090 [Desulfarculaceae bacterium]|nr:hypothetical protein [Desulfarculaceae bacterium]